LAQILTFEPDGHIYRLPDGEILPSVSEIIRFISREIYGTVTQFTLDNAANRGSAVHKACEILDKYGTVECDEITLPYVKAYVQFQKEHHKKWDGIEAPMHHEELKYAGTLDRIVKHDEGFEIWDFKTSSTVQKATLNAQLNGYRLMAEAEEMGSCRGLYCLHLTKDEKYKIVEVPIDDTLFMSCYNLHKALEKKRRKKNERE
jgi:hypothetical protein